MPDVQPPQPALQAVLQAVPLQVQRFAPVQFLSLVPVPARELEETVERAVAENPVLVRGPRGACRRCGAAGQAPTCPLHGDAGARPAPDEPVAVEDWHADLARDARLEVDRRLHPLVDRVVAGLDDHGLLRDPLDGPADDVAAALAAVRLVGPLGIAAASPLDCVRVQARTLAARGEAPDGLVDVVEGWLAEVAAGDLAAVARGTGRSLASVEACVAFVRRRLRPFVLLPEAGPRSGPVDVVLSRPARAAGGPPRDAGLEVHVPDAATLGLALDRGLARLGTDARTWLAPHHRAAVHLVAAVDARAWMLTRVAEVLVRRQGAFVVDGPSAHRPLRRAEVAHELGVHPSTVGRAVAGKVARCPDGRVVPLEDFFGATTSTRERVREALDALPGASDARVAAHLAASGVVVARRTVAKYRALARSVP